MINTVTCDLAFTYYSETNNVARCFALGEAVLNKHANT